MVKWTGNYTHRATSATVRVVSGRLAPTKPIRTLTGPETADDVAEPRVTARRGVLDDAAGAAITVLRWGSLGYGLVALAPGRVDQSWTDVVMLAVCVFMTTLRTLMPLQLGDRRPFHQAVPLFDVAVLGMAVGWTGATESPWLLCLLTAVSVAAYGWGSAAALGSGATSVAVVSIFYEVSGGNLANVLDDTNDLLAVVSLAVAAAGGVFLRSRVLAAETAAARAGGELDRLRAANMLLGELTDVALTLPGAFTLREALARTRTLLGTYLTPHTIALVTLDEHNEEWTPKIADRCSMRSAYPRDGLPTALRDALGTDGPLMASGEGWTWLSDGSRSGLYMVLRARDRAIGVLGLEHPDPGHFEEIDPVLRDGLADVIALTIDNARWFGRLRSLGAEEERLRVARDIHDRLGQWMTYIKMELERISASDEIDLRIAGPSPGRCGGGVGRAARDVASAPIGRERRSPAVGAGR